MKLLKLAITYALNLLCWVAIGIPTALALSLGVALCLAKGYTKEQIKEVIFSKY